MDPRSADDYRRYAVEAMQTAKVRAEVLEQAVAAADDSVRSWEHDSFPEEANGAREVANELRRRACYWRRAEEAAWGVLMRAARE